MKTFLCITLILIAAVTYGSTFERVLERQELRCGVLNLPEAELIRRQDGGYHGFYASFCQAYAVAIFQEERLIYYPVGLDEGFELLRAGEIDVMVGDVLRDPGHNRSADLGFGPVIFHHYGNQFAPVVAAGDDHWRDLITWLSFALMQAEEWGITSENVQQGADAEHRALRQFLGYEASMVEGLRLQPEALRFMIAKVGNYAEIYERHLGEGTQVGLERGPNRLWNAGGLLYPPPFALR